MWKIELSGKDSQRALTLLLVRFQHICKKPEEVGSHKLV